MTRRPIRIGLSARIYHPPEGATGLQSKPLQYLEQSVAHWAMSRQTMVLMIPAVSSEAVVSRNNFRLSDYAEYLDGLILQGGADVSPQSYGETPLDPAWAGDRHRDAYEMELLHEFMERRRPVLGICRGAQLINVALGGSLWQDIATQVDNATEHLHDDYDRHFHDVIWDDDSSMARLYPDLRRGGTVSIHHQAIKALGRGLRVEARGADDGVIEAVQLEGRQYVFGVQWHPEFHPPGAPHLLDSTPILDDFLAAARRRW